MPNDFDLDDLDDDETDVNLSEAQLIKQAQETGDVTPLVKHLRGVIKESRRTNKTLQQQVQDGADARKKLAFIEAKLPDNPQVKFFLDHYEGDHTAEAIRQAATEFGFLERQTQEEADNQNAVEQMMQANNGATQLAAPGTDSDLMERINAVKPGPNASKQIRDIMQSAGRYQSDE
jgi:hypothetical protein